MTYSSAPHNLRIKCKPIKIKHHRVLDYVVLDKGCVSSDHNINEACGNHLNRRHKGTSSATESLTESAFWVRPQSIEAKVSQLSRRKNLVAAMCPYENFAFSRLK